MIVLSFCAVLYSISIQFLLTMWLKVLLCLWLLPWVLTLTQLDSLTSWICIFWSWPIFKLRVRAMFSEPTVYFPRRLQVRLAVRTALRILFLPVWWTLWMIDEIFYSGYKSINLDSMVWIVSTQRTGSSNLCEALSSFNSRDFVCPRMCETVFPFICVNRLFDFLEWFFAIIGRDFDADISVIMKKVSGVNEDSTDHHPMTFYSCSQPEHVHAQWQQISPVSQFTIPNIDYFKKVSLFTELPPRAYEMMDMIRYKVMQKVSYRRGQGKVVVFKAHSSEDLTQMAKRFPHAKFIIGHRRPSQQIPSAIELVNSFQMSMSGTSCYHRDWIDERISYMGRLWKAEFDFYTSDDVSSDRKMSVPFNYFMKQPEEVLLSVYDFLGMKRDQHITNCISKYYEEHKAYKGERKYKNPKLEELGYNAEDIDGQYEYYVKRFNL